MKRNRKDGCRGKIRHKSRAGAIVHLKRLKNAGLHAYSCQVCQGWHVGHCKGKIQARLDQLLGTEGKEGMA